MKYEYKTPEMEITGLDLEDVITASENGTEVIPSPSPRWGE